VFVACTVGYTAKKFLIRPCNTFMYFVRLKPIRFIFLNNLYRTRTALSVTYKQIIYVNYIQLGIKIFNDIRTLRDNDEQTGLLQITESLKN